MPQVGSGVVRGLFYFYPDNPDVLTTAHGSQELTTWSLYWMSLPDESGPELQGYFEDRSDEYAVRLASGLKTWGLWSVFKDRQFQTECGVEWAADLPAYVRLDVETEAGVTVVDSVAVTKKEVA